MADRWFRVHEVGSGSMEDPRRPEFSDRCEGFSQFPVGGSPQFVMRAYADDATLDAIAAEPRVTEFSTPRAVEAFNASTERALAGVDRPIDADELERRQRVGGTV